MAAEDVEQTAAAALVAAMLMNMPYQAIPPFDAGRSLSAVIFVGATPQPSNSSSAGEGGGASSGDTDRDNAGCDDAGGDDTGGGDVGGTANLLSK